MRLRAEKRALPITFKPHFYPGVEHFNRVSKIAGRKATLYLSRDNTRLEAARTRMLGSVRYVAQPSWLRVLAASCRQFQIKQSNCARNCCRIKAHPLARRKTIDGRGRNPFPAQKTFARRFKSPSSGWLGSTNSCVAAMPCFSSIITSISVLKTGRCRKVSREHLATDGHGLPCRSERRRDKTGIICVQSVFSSTTGIDGVVRSIFSHHLRQSR